MAWIYYSQTTKKIELLDFLPTNDLALLWIKPQKYSFSQYEIKAFMEAFDCFYCILWFISPTNSASSVKLNEIKRAFGQWRKLLKTVFLKHEYFFRKTKYYSDLSILKFTEATEAENFLSRGLFGLDSTVFFLKHLNIDFLCFEPLANIWFRRLQEKTICYSQYKELKISNYVNIITKKEGIVGLVVEDTETRKSLILLGKEKQVLRKAFIRLQKYQYFDIATDSDLSDFIKRGISLKLLS